jgi:predicted Zn-dependent protease
VIRSASSVAGSRWGRVLIALILAGISLVSYFGLRSYNSVTGETQHINITVDQEIALGLQAAPEMAAEYGDLSSDAQAQALVSRVGQAIISGSAAKDTSCQFEFHLLADDQTINAFALPGGQLFITTGFLNQMETEAQLAAVLAHEVTHVVARHSAEQIAKTQLTQGLTGAAVPAAYDTNDPQTQGTTQVAMLIGQLVDLKFGRNDELEADRLGVRFMSEAGYDPRAAMRVMEILEASSQGQQPPEFFSTHPNPENRIAEIQAAIDAEFPNGVPEGLKQ